MDKVPGLHFADETGFNKIVERIKAVTNTDSDRAMSYALGFKRSAGSSARMRNQVPMAWLVEANLRFKADVSWLAYGGVVDQLSNNVRLVPVFEPKLTAQNELDTSEPQIRLPFDSEWLAGKGPLDELVLLRSVGNSMKPLIHDEDIILINKGDNQPQAEAGIFLVAFDQAIFIRWICLEPGKVVLRSENARLYPDVEIDLKDLRKIKILGRVVWQSHDLS